MPEIHRPEPGDGPGAELAGRGDSAGHDSGAQRSTPIACGAESGGHGRGGIRRGGYQGSQKVGSEGRNGRGGPADQEVEH